VPGHLSHCRTKYWIPLSIYFQEIFIHVNINLFEVITAKSESFQITCYPPWYLLKTCNNSRIITLICTGYLVLELKLRRFRRWFYIRLAVICWNNSVRCAIYFFNFNVSGIEQGIFLYAKGSRSKWLLLSTFVTQVVTPFFVTDSPHCRGWLFFSVPTH